VLWYRRHGLSSFSGTGSAVLSLFFGTGTVAQVLLYGLVQVARFFLYSGTGSTVLSLCSGEGSTCSFFFLCCGNVDNHMSILLSLKNTHEIRKESSCDLQANFGQDRG
jgi:hypothetical protein